MSAYSHIYHYYGDVHSANCLICKKIDEDYTLEEPLQQTDILYCHMTKILKENLEKVVVNEVQET